MSLLKRKPRKLLRVREAAAAIGCSSKSIRTGAIGNFTLIPLNPGRETTPLLVYEAEVVAFIERRERLAGCVR